MVHNQDRELKEVKALNEQRQVHIFELKKELHEQQSKLDELKKGNEPGTSSNQDPDIVYQSTDSRVCAMDLSRVHARHAKVLGILDEEKSAA